MSTPAPHQPAPKRFWSLRTQITVGLAALFLLATVLHFIFVDPALHRRIVDLEHEKIQIYADSVAFQISGDFQVAIKEIEAIAAVPLTRSLNLTEVSPMLTRLETISPSYLDFSLLDLSGRVIARPAKPERVGEDRSMRDYFRIARDQRRTYVSEVYITTATNRNLMVSTPVFDDSRTNMIAILAGSMALMDRNPEMYQAVLKPSVPKPWRVSLWTRDGQLLAHSNNNPRKLVQPAPGSTFLTDDAGELWHVACTTIANSGWKVLVQTPDTLVREHVNRVTQPIAGVVMASLLGLVVLGLVAARCFVRPLEALTTALNRFGSEGRFESVAPSGSGEIAGAIRAFNCMAIERQQVEAAFRNSEARFRSMFDSSLIGIVFWEWTGRITDANDAFLKIVGYDHDDLAKGKMNWTAMTPPEYRELDQRALAELAATGGCVSFEKEYIRKNGSRVPILIGGALLENAKDRGVAFVLDITERQQAESARRESLERFDLVARATNDAVWDWNLNTNKIWWNESFRTLFGYSAEEIEPGLEFWENQLHAEDKQRVLVDLHSVIDGGGQVWSDEYRFRRKDGSYAEILDRGYVLRDERGRAIRMIGAMQDITERKQSEETMKWRTQLALLRANIAECLTRGGDLKETSQRISEVIVTHLNAAFARIWTLNEAENTLELQSSAGLYTHLNGPHSRVKMGHYKIGRIAQNRKPHLTNDVLHDSEISDPAWAKREGMKAFAGYPLLVGERVVGVIALFARAPLAPEVMQELSHIADGLAQWILRKRAEENLKTAQIQLQDYTRELETRVAQRTSDLRAMNEQLESFVYSIAHDLRAPLRSMIGYSQLLVEDYSASLDATASQILKRIQASSEFMDKLVIDLLAYGRASSAEIELAPVEVQKQWEIAMVQCAAQIEQSQAQIEIVGPLPVVRAHEATLCQCLANLLSNALKFVESGVQPQVRFWAEDHGDYTRLWVADNGIGIPSEQKERVFRVFERLQSSRYSGTGIGLSIVRKGVERMGGRAGVECEPGKGCRFWIELPKAS